MSALKVLLLVDTSMICPVHCPVHCPVQWCLVLTTKNQEYCLPVCLPQAGFIILGKGTLNTSFALTAPVFYFFSRSKYLPGYLSARFLGTWWVPLMGGKFRERLDFNRNARRSLHCRPGWYEAYTLHLLCISLLTSPQHVHRYEGHGGLR